MYDVANKGPQVVWLGWGDGIFHQRVCIDCTPHIYVCVCVSEMGYWRLVLDSVYHRLVAVSVSVMFGLC